MHIILSPAKRMRTDDSLAPAALPAYLERTEVLLKYLQSLTAQQLKALWKCNDAIVEENIARLKGMDLRRGLTPAILAYDGIAYLHMAPGVFTDGQFRYVQEHLLILSAFYGALRPMDGVTPYRLELQAKAAIPGYRDLYDFWGSTLHNAAAEGDGRILNLASKEYAKAVETYLKPGEAYVTVSFLESAGGKLVTKGTYAKMARGEMVRYMAENGITDLADIRGFDRLGYQFRPALSTQTEYVFERILKVHGA